MVEVQLKIFAIILIKKDKKGIEGKKNNLFSLNLLPSSLILNSHTGKERKKVKQLTGGIFLLTVGWMGKKTRVGKAQICCSELMFLQYSFDKSYVIYS